MLNVQVVFTLYVLVFLGLAGVIMKKLCRHFASVANLHPPNSLNHQISKRWLEEKIRLFKLLMKFMDLGLFVMFSESMNFIRRLNIETFIFQTRVFEICG